MCSFPFSVSRSVMSNSLQPHGLWPTRLLCPWNSSGKNTGVGCHFLLHGIFPTQGLNPSLQHCRQILYHLTHQGNLPLGHQLFLLLSSKFHAQNVFRNRSQGLSQTLDVQGLCFFNEESATISTFFILYNRPMSSLIVNQSGTRQGFSNFSAHQNCSET